MLSDLPSIAETAGEFLLPHWRRWHVGWGPPVPTQLSQWTCVRSSLFLARVLNRCGLDAAFQSGRPVDQAPHGLTTDFGVLTASGWVSHAWVKAGDFLIDITADQFGHAPVILTSIGNPAYRSGDRAECRLIPTASGIAAVDDIWILWCENFERERLLMRPIRCM